MPDEKKGDKPELREDDAVARFRDAAGEPVGVTAFVGLLGRSAKEGHWLLYLGLDMNRCIEVRAEDILYSETLPPERSPFGSLGGTRVYVKRDAKVVATQSRSRTSEASAVGDEFDLDIRLGTGAERSIRAAPCFGTEFNTTCGADCGGGTGVEQTCFTCVSCGDTCFRTCDTCRTICGATCDNETCITCRTCRTQCGTCQTCQTRCGQATCMTCQTQCGTCETCRTQCGTCQTCQTQCGQATCQTCRTQCGTCPLDTCAACTHVTCFRTCDAC